ncbi:MAG TPA: hypothetical protein VI072_29230 [Polyangiaceae bacterium]
MDYKRSATLAAAVGVLVLAAGCGSEDTDENPGATADRIKCEGGNSCAGHSECAGADANSCQGMNECKGQGWVYTDTEDECAALQETNKAS